MKSYVVSAIAAIIAMVAFAEEVSPEQAKTAVRNWVRMNPQPMTAHFASGNGSAQTFSEGGKVLFHVVQLEGGGFVVTSGDTQITPIIAFSDNGEFVADLQNPLYALIEKDLSKRLESTMAAGTGGAKRNMLRASSAITPETMWAELLMVSDDTFGDDDTPPPPKAGLQNISDVRVAPMLQSKWNQSGRWNGTYIWNYYTPNNYVCGCTATAVSQVMRFWKAPRTFVQQHVRTCKIEGVETDMTMKGGYYDWENMPLGANDISDASQCEAIGRLTYDVGVASGMAWAKKGSSASLSNAADGLKNCFGFASADYINKGNSSGNLSGMPYANHVLGSLNARMPVVLAIYLEMNETWENGHAVVIDGYGYYNNVMYSHINVGYSGSGDAWYNLFGETITAGGHSWDTIWTCIVNINPDEKGRVLSGRLLDRTGAAVSGANVNVVSPSQTVLNTTSDANGIWFIRTQEGDGDFYIKATKSGLSSERKKVSSYAKDGNLWNVDLLLVSSDTPQPDLCFYKYQDWPKSVFLSNQANLAESASSFDVGSAIYLYCGFANLGQADVAANYKIKHQVLNSSGQEVSSFEFNATSDFWLKTGIHMGWGGNVLGFLQGLPVGSYTYRCTLDSGNALAESNESNNIATIGFTVVEPSSKPDLCFVKPEKWPQAVFLSDAEGATTTKNSFAGGSAIYLYNRFGNNGSSSIMKDYVIRHEVLDSSGTVVASGNYQCTSSLWLDIGVAKQWGGVLYPVLQNLSAGRYTYRCTLDSGNDIAEEDESNNVATVDFTIADQATYTLTINPNGGILNGANFETADGTDRQASVTVVYGEIYYWLLGTATRTGHVFEGWWTSASGGEEVYDSDGKAVIGGTYWNDSWQWRYMDDVTVYAHWRANTYMVSLDWQSGSDGSPSITATYGLPMPGITVPTRTGHTFGGYWTEPNGGGVQYYTSTGASAHIWDKTNAMILYAYWIKDSGGSTPPSWIAVTKEETMIVYASVFDIVLGEAIAADGALLAAFAPNGECRGVATIDNGPGGLSLFQLSVGVESATESGLILKVWNSATGEIGEINERISCNAGKQIGSLTEPRVFRVGASTIILNLKTGWSWVSTCLDMDDTSVGAVFGNCTFANEDIVKTSSGSATYYDGQWYPASFKIEPGVAYCVKKSAGGNESVTLSGAIMANRLTVHSGWNWIGSSATYDVPVSEVTHSGGFADEDIVKDSAHSTTYYDGQWFGSGLSTLKPGVGYKAKFANGGTLMFASGVGPNVTCAVTDNAVLATDWTSAGALREPEWSAKPLDDTMIAYLQIGRADGNGNFEADGCKVAAFAADGECRGVAHIENGPNGIKLFQLSIGVTSLTESGFRLKLWDSASWRIYEVDGMLANNVDNQVGKIFQPVALYAKEGLFWSIEDSVLTIGGNGEMADYDPDDPGSCPYSEYADYITEIVVEEGVTYIGERAFSMLPNVVKAVLPDSLEGIGAEAFLGCAEEIFDSESIPGVDLVDGWAVSSDETISGDLDLAGIRGIGDSAFSGCPLLTSVTIPDGARGIGALAFQGCVDLTTVAIPNSVACIGENAFSGCAKLRIAYIPNRYIGHEALLGIPSTCQTIRRDIYDFVYRLYALCLGRAPDKNGINTWSWRLSSGTHNGAMTAFGFCLSTEMERRNLSNAEYVEVLYGAIMGRAPDTNGKAYWVNLLDNGVSRRGVFRGFAESAEFTRICNDYGIVRGNVDPARLEERDKNRGVTMFVARCYTKALNRNYDVKGLNSWCAKINSSSTKKATAIQVAKSFLNSNEFKRRNLSNSAYVDVLYRTFFDRNPDTNGKKKWLGQLDSGVGRDKVMASFYNSKEFATIMAGYGIR